MADLDIRAYLAQPDDTDRIDARQDASLSFARSVRPAAAAARDDRHRATDEVRDVDPPIDFEPISRSKITAAPLRPETLHRTRLLDRLERHTRRRLTFVIANAGYGKTTLLADFAERARPRSIWFRLDHTDGDWVTFLNYMAAAMQTLVPDFGRATYSLFSQVPVAKPSLESAVRAFMVDIANLDEEPILLILDDYHLVDEAPDVQAIVARLLRDAPAWLHLVISSRREPELPVARLQAHGDVATIDSTDLRFTRDELETLFADSWGQPLEPDVIDMLYGRTEGWAACIQLLQSALRDMRAVEIRRFVEHLSVTDGPVYDYLAQEVLREARPDLRAFLVRASILDPIFPAYVVAAMRDLPGAPDGAAALDLIRLAYEVGLLSRRDTTSGSFRFHPLLREFLEDQLRAEVSAQELADAHRRVAQAAEPVDWLTACRHYLAAGDHTNAVRQLDRSVLTAVGTGAWGQAAEIVDALRGETTAPDVEVILALEETEQGRLAEAIARLDAIDRDTLGPQARALVRHGLLRAHYMSGDEGATASMIDEVLADAAAPQLFRNLAEGHRLVFGSGLETDLAYVVARLQEMVRQHADAELHYFAAVSLHNLMMAHFYRAEYQQAIATGTDAVLLFEKTGRDRECHSTHAVMAICSAELGRPNEAADYAAYARTGMTPDVDGIEPLSYLAIATGDDSFVGDLVAALRHNASVPPAARTEAQAVRRFAAIARPDLVGDIPWDDDGLTVGFGSGVEARALRAFEEFVRGGNQDPTLSLAALSAAHRTGNKRWAVRLEVLAAAVSADSSHLTGVLDRAARSGTLALADTAEVVLEAVAGFRDIPDAVQQSIRLWPKRWLPLLRRRVAGGYDPVALLAARALDSFGTLADVPLLRAFDRTYLRGSRIAGLGRGLVARQSPNALIHDLGRAYLEVGDRLVPIGTVRRRAAALMYYLISRPTQTATREQLMEGLWPDLVPASAANSLNQTLYFLRREFDPFYSEDESYEYVSNRGELVWLDPTRVRASSCLFLADASAAIRAVDSDATTANAVLRRYRGRFASEFEYEDWAQDWRDHLHSTFLHLGRALQGSLAQRGAFADSADVARYVLAEDPRALDVERGLVWTYGAAKSQDAAAAQYQHYAASYREAYAAAPPSFEHLLAEGPLGSDD